MILRGASVPWAPRPLQVEGVLEAVDPVLIGMAIGGLALLAAIILLIRRLGQSPAARLRAVLAQREAVVVLMHPNPDPDAMACAMGVATIAESVDTDATIQHAGEIRHPENRSFRTLLELDMEVVEAPADLVADDVVLVDHNVARGFTGAGGIEPIAVIDHHPGDGTGSEFTDVRPEYGAAATIVAEYYQSLGAPVGADDASDLSVDSALATGLVYGIMADTNTLTKGATGAEFDALQYLAGGIDEDLLERIANPEVSDVVLQAKADAIRNKRVDGAVATCDLDVVASVDAIPQAADELIQLEGVTAVVVYGEHDGTLHLSGRSRDDRIHMGDALEAVVEEIPMAEAGGHRRMGGGQLSIDHMNGIGPSEGLSREEFDQQVRAALDGELT